MAIRMPRHAGDVDKFLNHFQSVCTNPEHGHIIISSFANVEPAIGTRESPADGEGSAEWTRKVYSILDVARNALVSRRPDGSVELAFGTLCLDILLKSFLPKSSSTDADEWNKKCVEAVSKFISCDWSVDSIRTITRTIVPTIDSIHRRAIEPQLKNGVVPITDDATDEQITQELTMYFSVLSNNVADDDFSPDTFNAVESSLKSNCDRSLTILLTRLAAIDPPCSQTMSVYELLRTNFTKKHVDVAKAWYETMKPWAELVVDVEAELALFLQAAEAIRSGQRAIYIESGRKGVPPDRLAVEVCISSDRIPSARLCFVAQKIQESLPSVLKSLPLGQRVRDVVGNMDELIEATTVERMAGVLAANTGAIECLRRTVSLFGLLKTANKACIRYAQWNKDGRKGLESCLALADEGDDPQLAQQKAIKTVIGILSNPKALLPMVRTSKIMTEYGKRSPYQSIEPMVEDEFGLYMSDEEDEIGPDGRPRPPIIHDLRWLRLSCSDNGEDDEADDFDGYAGSGVGF